MLPPVATATVDPPSAAKAGKPEEVDHIALVLDAIGEAVQRVHRGGEGLAAACWELLGVHGRLGAHSPLREVLHQSGGAEVTV